MKTPWILGNQLQLLENGEAFFPRVFETIAAARHEVLLETFILFEDRVGQALLAALLKAASRGVRIDVTVDGFGSPDLSDEFVSRLTGAGVRLHVFDPAPRLWGWRTNVLRRMHRKIVVIDGERAFVGGINYSVDHLVDSGPGAKQDYAVEIEGPVVAQIRGFAVRAIAAGHRSLRGPRQALMAELDAMVRFPPILQTPAPKGHMAALFVTRDNRHHTHDIERHYRIAIRAAKHRVMIANAYFFPGYRLLRDLRRAARRGVRVDLILQGQPDMPIVKTAASLLYQHLISAGVHIHEYAERPLHGKVAISDSEWATVGSSNLDPLSLSLNLEANIIVRDAEFNHTLASRLEELMRHRCREICAADVQDTRWWPWVRSFFVFHLLRFYPAWASWLPAHRPQLQSADQLAKNDGRLSG